jgi:hypothetical protein
LWVYVVSGWSTGEVLGEWRRQRARKVVLRCGEEFQRVKWQREVKVLRLRKREGERESGEEIEMGSIVGLRRERDKKLEVLGRGRSEVIDGCCDFPIWKFPFVLSVSGK